MTVFYCIFRTKNTLAFNDTRKFGRVWLTDQPDEILGKLGPEPLEEQFTAQWLFENLHTRQRQLKPLLLDQTFLAGLGNIYTDECLHIAKLHPQRASNTVSQKQAAALREAIRAVLAEGIRRNGASIDWVYRGGDFQNYFRVYGRDGEPCPVCGCLDTKTHSRATRHTHLPKLSTLEVTMSGISFNPTPVFYVIVGLLIGMVIGWLIGFFELERPLCKKNTSFRSASRIGHRRGKLKNIPGRTAYCIGWQNFAEHAG